MRDTWVIPRNQCCLALNWTDKGERSEVYWTVIGATCEIIQLLSTDVSQACASHASTAQATLQCPGPGGTQTSCECWCISTSRDGILCLTPVIITQKTTVFIFLSWCKIHETCWSKIYKSYIYIVFEQYIVFEECIFLLLLNKSLSWGR